MSTQAERELVVRRRIGVALLGHAYMMAAYRESPAASGLHTVFVRWYIANRGLFGTADAALRAIEATRGPRLTAELGYNASSGYALGIALSDVASAFVNVWRVPAPATQTALPDWMEQRGFFEASATAATFHNFDTRIRTQQSLDPLRIPEVAQQMVVAYINTGVMPEPDRTVFAEPPGVQPGEIRAMEYEGTPEGPKGSTSNGTPQSSSTAVTPSSANITPFRPGSSAQVVVGVLGVGVAGVAVYLLLKRVAK